MLAMLAALTMQAATPSEEPLSPAAMAARRRDQVMRMMAMMALGRVDLKSETATQFCQDRKRFCDR